MGHNVSQIAFTLPTLVELRNSELGVIMVKVIIESNLIEMEKMHPPSSAARAGLICLMPRFGFGFWVTLRPSGLHLKRLHHSSAARHNVGTM